MEELRRRTFLTLLASGIAGAHLSSEPVEAQSTRLTWQMHRGGPGRANSIPLHSNLTENVSVAWTHEWEEGAVNTPPTPVFDEERYYLAAKGQQAVALDRSSREPVWFGPSGDHSTPIVSDDVVVFTTRQSIHGFDKRGNQVWIHDREGETYRDESILDGDTVYVRYTSTSGGIKALDVRTGEVQWSADRESFVSPVVGNGGVYFGSGRYAAALDAQTGDMLWTTEQIFDDEWIEDDVYVYANGRVFVPSVDGLAAVDATTGDVLWRYEHRDEEIYVTPTVSDGVVFQPIHGNSTGRGQLVALNADSGEEQWRVDTTSNIDYQSYSAVAATPDTVLALHRDRLEGIDRETGERRFATTLQPSFNVASGSYGGETFAYDGQYLLIGSRSRIIALEPSTVDEKLSLGGLVIGGLAAAAAYLTSGDA